MQKIGNKNRSQDRDDGDDDDEFDEGKSPRRMPFEKVHVMIFGRNDAASRDARISSDEKSLRI